jgi:aspartate-semialdehyde dehydrogenase
MFASRAREDVRETTEEALRAYDAVFFAGSEDASERYAPPVLARGGIVIDNSSTFRMREGVPLVVPEVNAHAVRPEHRLFPVGNCTAIILCMALAPVRDAAGLHAVYVATYQSVSGAGRAALEAFDRGEGNVVGNVIPHIGQWDASGYTGEEMKIAQETRKVLELPDLNIFATAVRVPVRTAHSEAVFFETLRPTSVEKLSDALGKASGVVFHAQGEVTPREVEGTDEVHVARLRMCEDGLQGSHFQMWVVGDQLRKGAATNGVQILELLLQRGVIT